MRRINEDLSKRDVENIVASKLSSFGSSSDFKKLVRDITADAIEDLYKTLWNRSGSWKSGVKK